MYTNINKNKNEPINLESIYLNYNEKSKNLYSILSNINQNFNNKYRQEDCYRSEWYSYTNTYCRAGRRAH